MASAAQHRVRRIAQYALEPVPVEVVLDAFGGSGTTLIAAEKTARAARLIELDPKYVDVIVHRWQDWTGELLPGNRTVQLTMNCQSLGRVPAKIPL